MQNNRDAWTGFLTKDGETPEKRLARMAEPLEFAEHFELTAVSSILQRQLHLYNWESHHQNPKQAFTIITPSSEKTPIMGVPILLFNCRNIHYDLLRIARDKKDVHEYERELADHFKAIDAKQDEENDNETVLSNTIDKGVEPSLLDNEHNPLNTEGGDEQEKGSIGNVDEPSNNRPEYQAHFDDVEEEINREVDKIDDNATYHGCR